MGYPLNAITLVPAAEAELYLMQPDGTPFANQKVTLRGGVYLEDNYCGEDVSMGPDSNSLVPGNTDGTYTTDGEGKLTVHMDATQFNADGYTGPLTNAALDYWFELRDLNGNQYYPVLVNVQGSMSADRILRTGSAVVVLEEVPDGEENKPYLTAQTLSYGEEDGSGELQVRNVLDSTGKVGPNSTYKYAELTSYFTLWGVDNDKGGVTVSMTGENGYAPEGQLVKDDTFPFASIPILTNTTVLTKATMTDSGWLEPETAESLRASVYQNGELVKQVTMPFQVIGLTEVEPVNVDATAVMVDMSARFRDGIGNGGSDFSFTAGGSNSVTRAFNGNIEDMLGDIQEVTNPLFRVLITPSEDNSVFNVLIWGGYNSLNLQDFDYTQDGFSMDCQLMEPQLDFGVPSVNEIGEMAAGTYDPADTLTLNAMGGTHNNLDFGAQLEGYYEGQFYYDTDQRAWCFRAINGGFTAGAGVSFQANVNAWVGPIPITGSFGAGIALQLDYKAATIYTDQQDADTLATWTDAARQSDSVNDYLTTLRINGYIDAFGGFGFDYTIIALKIGLFGRLAGDSTNRFLSRTYLENEDDAQMDGQALGINGEVGIKFVAKFLFISYETVLGSGSIGYSHTFNDWSTIDTYWGGASGGSLQRGAPTLLSRSYLEAYANGATRWNSGAAQFGGTATVVQEDANPGSEPAVNDDGSLSVYISDENSDSYFDSRIRAGAVGAEGKIIDDDTDNKNNGHGDMSPSLSGDSSFTVAAWIRLFEDLEDDKKEGEALSAAEQKQLLNSTEIMVATTGDNGGNWKVQQLTENASPDLAPVTASNGTSAVVFWRSAYASDPENLLNFDTQNAIYYSRYNGSMWSEPKMAYNGSIGSVVGLQASMLSDGTALAAFTVDRDPADDVSTDYEMAYRVIGADDALGDLVVLTSDDETDTNPQAAAVSANGTGHFVLAWYSTQDGGDIRLQAVGSDGQLYSGGSNYTVPASVKAVSQEDGLVISSDFRLAKRAPGSGIDGLTLVWAETVPNGEGQADHSVLYGAQLCQAGGRLSTPQALITLPDRTLANSFSAWRDGSGKVSAYIFGTYYDPAKTETVPVSDGNDSTKGYEVAADTDKLLTGGGTMQARAISVDSIVVDYANLQTNSFTPVVFTLRNTGTTVLDAATVAVGGYSAAAPRLNPGDSAGVTVLYKAGAAIANPTYTITTGGSPLASGTLHLDYNDIGISSMKVVEESQGKRTVLVTLYNDSAAKLAGSGRTVELRFYSDSEHSQPASVTLKGTQSGVTCTGDTITLTGSALSRLDQGSMALLVTYDLASYVTGTLQQEEVPASGVYLYANALVKESGKTMAEHAQGNNSTGVQLTGAYARTGEETTLDTALDNSGAATTADVTLQNNCLQPQPDKGTLLAVLLDENGNALETKAVTENTGLSCEETKKIQVTFGQKGSDVILLYAPANSTGLQLRFTNMNVGLSDFVEDPANPNVYTYALPGNAPASTSVIFVSGDVVTVNGAEQGNSGSVEVAIPTGTSTITVESGGKTYSLTLNRTDGTGGNPGDGGGSVIRPTYPPNILETEHGTVTVSPARPHQGDRVTITTQPDEGYKLGEITVTRPNGQKVTLTPAGDGKYTFTQPGVKVTIDVTFVPEEWPFVDVAESDWFFQAVKYVFERGIMVGTSDTTFEPQSSVTRGQVVQMLYNLEGQPTVTGEDGFTDVQAKDWWYNAVVWALKTRWCPAMATARSSRSGTSPARSSPRCSLTTPSLRATT